MPSKLKRAIGAVKDQTSISLAKVSNTNASNIEVLILKATRHDEVPVDDRYVNEVLQLISSNKVFAASCAQAIAKRIGKTRNWIVALKSLMLVLRVFQDGDLYFPREVLHQMKKGHKILNLSSFRDDSNSSPWDYTAFVRTFALYLDERLDCFVRGKLQKRYTNRDKEKESKRNIRRGSEPVCDMKPGMLLDRITNWQRLLDRAMGTRPTGAAKNNRLIQISLYAIVQESFELYRDISDGLALLLDSFFHLQYESCLNAFQACVKASKQFEELCEFYDLCKGIGVGRTSEYPSVQKISEELIVTLQEFLKDQASFPGNGRSPAPIPSNFQGPVVGSSSDPSESWEQTAEMFSENQSECTSLEDLMSVTEGGTSPLNMDRYSNSEISEKPSLRDDIFSASLPVDQQPGKDMTLDLLFFENWSPENTRQQQGQEQNPVEQNLAALDLNPEASFDWETELAESTTLPVSENLAIVPFGQNSFDQNSAPQNQYNPFLLEETGASSMTTTISSEQGQFPVTDTFNAAPTFSSQNSDQSLMAPTFLATPTFSTQNSGQNATGSQDDLFGSFPGLMDNKHVHSNGTVDQQIVLQEQQLWLQNQNKIIAKHIA
ncbi:hypothetical protein Ddye_016472 [Dipteronia dyeriana]|uniref:ENTH domain-containing protein n=1 Tax=Dipteronia dyeriana TaxID=168575 RepID=A0AAD9U7K2_9ROSI|nr:hypothetical protein Ddye_016472 [Dipteronia dyeriana]